MKEKKKKIFFRDHVEKSDYSTRWYETIDYVFFFFIIKFQSMTFTYDDCALYYQIKTLINF